MKWQDSSPSSQTEESQPLSLSFTLSVLGRLETTCVIPCFGNTNDQIKQFVPSGEIGMRYVRNLELGSAFQFIVIYCVVHQKENDAALQ